MDIITSDVNTILNAFEKLELQKQFKALCGEVNKTPMFDLEAFMVAFRDLNLTETSFVKEDAVKQHHQTYGQLVSEVSNQVTRAKVFIRQYMAGSSNALAEEGSPFPDITLTTGTLKRALESLRLAVVEITVLNSQSVKNGKRRFLKRFVEYKNINVDDEEALLRGVSDWVRLGLEFIDLSPQFKLEEAWKEQHKD